MPDISSCAEAAGASPRVKAAQDEQRPEDVVDTIGGAAAMVSEVKLPKASCFA